MAQVTERDAHPNDNLLLALNDGVLFPGDKPLVEGHLKTCARCQARLTALTEDISVDAPVHAPRSKPGGVPTAVLRRLLVVVVLLGILGGAGIVARREFTRRTSEPVALATTPEVPVSEVPPVISGIPTPPAPEPVETAPIEPPAPETAAPSASTPASPPPALTADPLVVTSPNRNFRWRVVGLTVERTTNGGAEWRKQSVELTKQIASGAAPSAAVCWLVGRGGAIFVAVGSQWKNVSLTEPVDLVRVAAIDSSNATVTAMDGRQFSTSDAGMTWNLLAQ